MMPIRIVEEYLRNSARVYLLVERDAVLAKAPLTAGQEELEFVVDVDQMLAQFATVRLQIVDAVTHAPIAGAKVGIDGAHGWTQPVATDGDGRIERTDLMPGEYRLTAKAEGQTLPPTRFVLAAGSTARRLADQPAPASWR